MLVVELSDVEESAAYCGKLFRRWGAEVVKVESSRRADPGEALDRYLNGGKRRLALDLDVPGQRAALDRLLAAADVLVTDASAAQLQEWGLLTASGEGPAARVSITPFGLSGPYRDAPATASTLLALGGYTFLSGDEARAPLTFPGNYPFYQAGTFAYVAALAAYLRRLDGGAPLAIEVSVLEVLASLHQFTDVMWTLQGEIRSRHGNRWENLCPTTMLPCADGWVALNILPNFWPNFTYMLGRPELAEDPRYATNPLRMEHREKLEALIAEVFEGWTREQIFREGQETWRVPVGVLLSLGEVLEDRHLRARGFWRPVEGGDGTLVTAGSAYRFVGEEPPAEPPEQPRDAKAGVDDVLAQTATVEGSAAPGLVRPRLGHRPLEGVRVVDLTRIWSGPVASRLLADLGAEVIKIEAPTGRGPAVVPRGAGGYYPDNEPGEKPWNRQGLNNKLNRNKRSVALDLKDPRGREIFLRLVSVSDVVIENFSARAMPALDLGYERLRAANEQIIYLPMPAFGLSGPYRDYIGLGPSIEPLTGMTALMGYSDDEPRASAQALTDAISGTTAAAAVLTALRRRAETGEGAYIDLSQEEAGVAFFGEQFVERQLTGREPTRWGNAHPQHAPHGVYRCASQGAGIPGGSSRDARIPGGAGDDDWIAIAVRDEREWRGLCALAGRGWEGDARFGTLEARRKHRTELDAAIEEWTREREKGALMRDLHARGVPAGAVQSAPEWLSDPHLEARGYFFQTEELDAGRQRYDGLPIRFDATRGYEDWRRAPGFGEDNERVLRELLAYSDDEIRELQEAGVIVERPPTD